MASQRSRQHEVLPFTHPDKRYYPETGHTVAFAFLEFYEDHGGPALFGYPITEWIIETNGRIVQYFERVKLEWYPENPPGQRVQPGMLGVIYVEQYCRPDLHGKRRLACDLDSRRLGRLSPHPNRRRSPRQ